MAQDVRVREGAAEANPLFLERARRRLTQRQLASLAGLTQAQVSRIENGRIWPSERAIKGLSAALGMTLTEIFEAALSARDAASQEASP
jgi:transcriptional regulator with XRE-family HTH domain